MEEKCVGSSSGVRNAIFDFHLKRCVGGLPRRQVRTLSKRNNLQFALLKTNKKLEKKKEKRESVKTKVFYILIKH